MFVFRNYAQILKDYLQILAQDVKESSGPLFRAATKHALGEGKLSVSPLGLNTMGNIGIDVGKVSNTISIITIFGHNHFKLKFVNKNVIFFMKIF